MAPLLGDGGMPPPQLHVTGAGEPILEVIERLLESLGIGTPEQALGGPARKPVGARRAAVIGADQGLPGGGGAKVSSPVFSSEM